MNRQALEIKIIEIEHDYQMGARYYWMPILELLGILQDYLQAKQNDSKEE